MNLSDFFSETSNRHGARLKEAKFLGRKSGLLNIPFFDDQNESPYEIGLRNSYASDISELKRIGEPQLKKLNHEIEKQNEEIQKLIQNEDDYVSELIRKANETALIAAENLQEAFDSTAAIIEEKRVSTIRKLNETTDELHEVELKVNRKTRDIWFSNEWLYVIWMALIGIAEIPLNNSIFQDFLQESEDKVLLINFVSLTIALGIPLAAHSAGLYLKRSQERKINWFLFGIITFLYLLLMLFISYVRMYVLIDNNERLTDEVNKAYLGYFFSFYILNIFLFAVATIVSYSHHDSNTEFSNLWNKKNKFSKSHDKEMLNIIAEKNQLFDEHKSNLKAVKDKEMEEIERANNIRVILLAEYTNAKKEYSALLQTLHEETQKIIHHSQEAINKFQQANLENRTDGKNPQSFQSVRPPLENPFPSCEESTRCL